ncbi:MAG: hypothetical protein Q8L87_01925 [Anaerolineales bacterium]|nr:hypothetical protein [Anaerolineales bacterium]MDP1985222.1 hypothetical protein [Sulfuritalea sp.]
MGIVEEQGALPPAAWFQASGYAMLVNHVYEDGKTWGDLRQACGSFDTSSFVPSRCGLRWRSHPEASLSNFLFARGIRHDKGRKYPDAYAAFSGKTYGYYDLLFYDKTGRFIDVEIWGDKPNGHNEAIYAKVRETKERFNLGRSDFLGIHYSDCRSDVSLSKILERYIGIIEPSVFEQPQDRFLETTHWSNADELLDTCRQIAAQQPDGKFPAEDWLRKRGKWAHREGPAYNTLSVYIKLWIGGIRKVRQLLGQEEHSTIQWDRGMALRELKAWYDTYGKSPGAVRRDVDRGVYQVAPDEIKRGSRIAMAIDKYAGGIITACAALGIKPSRKSPKQEQGKQ